MLRYDVFINFNLVGIDCTKPDGLVDPFDKLKATLGKPIGEKAEG